MALIQKDETKWTPPRGRRWTVEDGRALVAALDARPARESVAAFARRHGLEAQRVHWWRTRVCEASAASPVRFAPVTIVPTRAPSSFHEAAAVDIVVGRRCVRVRAGFDAEALRSVLAVLEGGASC